MVLKLSFCSDFEHKVSRFGQDFEVDTVAHVDDEKRVDNSFVQIWKVKFGLKAKFLFRL